MKMQLGAQLLKFGRKGAPHMREFKLSVDEATLSWQSKGKKALDTTIQLRDVQEVLLGQQTDVFKRRSSHASQAHLSFSLVVGGSSGARTTLDLVCSCAEEFDTWCEGLMEVVKHAKLRPS